MREEEQGGKSGGMGEEDHSNTNRRSKMNHIEGWLACSIKHTRNKTKTNEYRKCGFLSCTPPGKWKVAGEEWRRANTLRQRSDLAEVHSVRWQSRCFGRNRIVGARPGARLVRWNNNNNATKSSLLKQSNRFLFFKNDAARCVGNAANSSQTQKLCASALSSLSRLTFNRHERNQC